MSAAITLRRELLEVTATKIASTSLQPDSLWPLTEFTHQKIKHGVFEHVENLNLNPNTTAIMQYWSSLQDRYQPRLCLDRTSLSQNHAESLPLNWTVVTISITEDKSTLFLSRQRDSTAPLVFCVPFERHNRKDEGHEDQYSYEEAMAELTQIIKESDATTNDASELAAQGDPEVVSQWWSRRRGLDRRLRELLDNIEFCWLGAFKVCGNRSGGCISCLPSSAS